METQFILTPVDQIKEIMREVVRDEVRKKYEEDESEKLLSPDGACRLLGISHQTLRTYERNGMITKKTLGDRRIYFRKGDVLALVKSHKKYSRN